jgi:hypothetical protein
VLTPLLDVIGASPLSASLSWTPGPDDLGLHQIVFVVTDVRGLQSLLVLRVLVVGGQSFQRITSAPLPWACTAPSGAGAPDIIRCETTLVYGQRATLLANSGPLPLAAIASGRSRST